MSTTNEAFVNLKAGKVPPGRPRSEVSRLSILETAYELMSEFPVQSVTTHQIAAKAGVSTATVYRWWDTKEALLLDAFLHMKEKNSPPTEGMSPLKAIREHCLHMSRFLEGDEGRVAARIIAAIQDDAVLREAFIERLYLPQSCEMQELGQAAVDAGELPAGANVKLFLDTIFGNFLVRLMVRHEPISHSDAEEFFSFALAAVFQSNCAERTEHSTSE